MKLAELWETAERRILIGLVVLGGLVLGFLQIVDEVSEGEAEFRALDEAVLRALRNPGDLSDPLGPLWVEEVMRDITALGSMALLTLGILATALYLLLRRSALAAVFLVVAVTSGLGVGSAFKALFSRPRPDLVPHHAEVYTSSFPSGHSLMAAVTWLTLASLVARGEPRTSVKLYLVLVALTITVLVGISRVYLGVHYPSDVLGGWVAGAAWAILAWGVQEAWVEYRQRKGRSTAGMESQPDPEASEEPAAEA